MDLARRVYSRDLKIAAMREIDGGRPISEVARHLELSPHLLDRWRGEWRARGELAFPGLGRRGVTPAMTDLQRIGELERKIGQLTMENALLKRAVAYTLQQRNEASSPLSGPRAARSRGGVS
jgi:transposase